MKAAYLPDIVRAFERSYSKLATDTANVLFDAAVWFGSGTPAEVTLKLVMLGVVGIALMFALGGAKAMGDKKAGGTLAMWGFIGVVFLGGLAVAFVLISSDTSAP